MAEVTDNTPSIQASTAETPANLTSAPANGFFPEQGSVAEDSGRGTKKFSDISHLGGKSLGASKVSQAIDDLEARASAQHGIARANLTMTIGQRIESWFARHPRFAQVATLGLYRQRQQLPNDFGQGRTVERGDTRPSGSGRRSSPQSLKRQV